VKAVLDKVLSARFLMAVIFTITCCIGFLKGMVQSEAFVGIVVLICNEYFKRTDREQPANGGTKP